MARKTPKATPRPAEPRVDAATLQMLDAAAITLPTNQPWIRPAWMDAGIVRPLLTLTPQGTPAHPECWFESQKGTGKSFSVLAVHLAEAVVHPNTLVLVAGKDRGAIEVDKDFLVHMIRTSPLLTARCRILANSIHVQGGSRVEFLASDEPGSHGGGGTHPRWRAVCEDIFAWGDLTLLDSLLAMSGKTPNSRVTVCTNPAAKKSGRLWALRKAVQRSGHFWAPWAEGAGPVVEWISPAWRLRMQDTLPPGLFARFVQGTWSEDSSFVTRAQIESCIGDHRSGRAGTGRVNVGLDIGIKRHHCGLAWGQPSAGRFYLHGSHRWDPARLPGHEVPLEAVEQEVRHVAQGYGSARLLYDPMQAVQLAQSLRRDWGEAAVQEFSFGVSNQVRLAQAFYEAIVKRLLVFPADVPDLVDEVASLDTVPVGFGFRFEFGGDGSGHGDVAVATALSYFCALSSPSGLQGLKPRPDLIGVAGRRTGPASPRDKQLIWMSTGMPTPWNTAGESDSLFDRYDAGTLPGQAEFPKR